jgi:hypothetical protein
MDNFARDNWAPDYWAHGQPSSQTTGLVTIRPMTTGLMDATGSVYREKYLKKNHIDIFSAKFLFYIICQFQFSHLTIDESMNPHRK